MIDLFKALKKDYTIYAPIKGQCIDITEVKDPVFSTKMLGDGVALIPYDNVVYAPCDGVITMIFPTKHAIGIKMDDGTEIMVHIGIDTVNLKGKGFTSDCKQKQKIKRGMKLVSFDSSYLSNTEFDFTIIIVVTNNGESYIKTNIGNQVDCIDEILKRV